MLIVDQSTDISGQVLRQIAATHPLPLFVKSAGEASNLGDTEELAAHIYAYQQQRMFPCHTKSATWLSAAYFAQQRDSVHPVDRPQIVDHLQKQANFFNIGPVVATILAAPVFEEESLPDSSYALIVKTADDRTERLLPLRDAEEVKVAADWFYAGWKDMPFDIRHEIATRIHSKLAESDTTENHEQLEKTAGMGFCDKDDIVSAWAVRGLLTRSTFPEHSKQAIEIAETVRKADIDLRDTSLRIKMAATMDDFDIATNLRSRYCDTITWPENTLFHITEKQAMAFVDDHVMLLNGSVYKKADLAKISSGQLQDWLGDAFADKCGGVLPDPERIAKAAAALNEDSTRLFNKLAQSAGIYPTAVGPEPVPSLSQAQIDSFASSYMPVV